MAVWGGGGGRVGLRTVISNRSLIFLFLPNDKIVHRMYKVPLFCSWTLHVWPIYIFCSRYHYNIVKRTGVKWEQGQISTACKGHYFFNTKLSKLTKWEMYGKQKNSCGNLVSQLKGQLISAQSLLYIMYAYWQNLNTSVLPDAVLVNFDWMNWASKERRKEKLKGQLEKGMLPLFCHVHRSACFPTLDVILWDGKQKHAVNNKTSIFENLEDSIL